MTTARRHIVVVGAIGKLPYAGMTMYWLHYVRGLQELGYVVHYVERQNKPGEYYDPESRDMHDADARAAAYLDCLRNRFHCAPDSWTLVTGNGQVLGTPLQAALAEVEVAMIVADATWLDELTDVRHRLFIDGDPMFTQAAYAAADPLVKEVVDNSSLLFTYGTRIGLSDCPIPLCGRVWLPTRPVVATSLWSVRPAPPDAPFTGLMHWAAGSDVELDGRAYGHKDREFEKFIDLPSLVQQPCRLAVGGRKAPRHRLAEAGWSLVDPLAATLELPSYRAFISGSLGDFGVAKHAYVASRSGWFSDRATCFLASGRPVLHQDTGFREALDIGEDDGVIPFTDLDDLQRGVRLLVEDQNGLTRRARRTAERLFEARTVITQMFEAAGIANYSEME